MDGIQLEFDFSGESVARSYNQRGQPVPEYTQDMLRTALILNASWQCRKPFIVCQKGSGVWNIDAQAPIGTWV